MPGGPISSKKFDPDNSKINFFDERRPNVKKLFSNATPLPPQS
jgi:hypothetical protein